MMNNPQPPRVVATMTVGPYHLVQYDDGVTWIKGEDGRMVKVPAGELVKKIDELYQGRFS